MGQQRTFSNCCFIKGCVFYCHWWLRTCFRTEITCRGYTYFLILSLLVSNFTWTFPGLQGLLGAEGIFQSMDTRIDDNCQGMLLAQVGFPPLSMFYQLGWVTKMCKSGPDFLGFGGVEMQTQPLITPGAGSFCDLFYSPVKTSAAPLTPGILHRFAWQLHHSLFASSNNPGLQLTPIHWPIQHLHRD